MTNEEIYAWLKTQRIQTELCRDGEYTMMFYCDLPKLLLAFHEHMNTIETNDPSKVFDNLHYDRTTMRSKVVGTFDIKDK